MPQTIISNPLDAGLPEAVACLDSVTGDAPVESEEAGGGADCSTIKVCVETGTTTIDAVRKILPEDTVVEVTMTDLTCPFAR